MYDSDFVVIILQAHILMLDRQTFVAPRPSNIQGVMLHSLEFFHSLVLSVHNNSVGT